jgi:hypothetical protein
MIQVPLWRRVSRLRSRLLWSLWRLVWFMDERGGGGSMAY